MATSLQFKTHDEATAYFGIRFPNLFVDTMLFIDDFCKDNKLDTLDTLLDVFGILRVEGKEARYRQTPIEFFPFCSTGSDGIHYGFIIHTLDEDDYPSGELCPMDGDGVISIADDTADLFQNLITDESIFSSHRALLEPLNINRSTFDRERYDPDGNGFRAAIKPKLGWQWLSTADGAGVLAQHKYFHTSHLKTYDRLDGEKSMETYQRVANEMKKLGLYASQLYYLKELYWHEWTNHAIAKDLLAQMLEPYEKLNRPHLYETAKWALDTFDKGYGF